MVLDRIVAVVNGEVITWSELRDRINIEGPQYLRGLEGQEREERIESLEVPFLNRLIEMKIIEQRAREMGIDVSDEEIGRAIQDIRAKLGMNEEAFLESLRAENMTPGEYRDMLKQQILIQKAINMSVKQRIVISEEDIDAYIQDHASDFPSGQRWRIRQIFFKAPVSKEDRKSIEQKADEIYRRLRDGADFATLAREYSQGPERDTGGDLGYIDPQGLMSSVRDTAAALGEGEVSRPFWSEAGLHIIKIEDKIDVHQLPEMREKIREMLFKEAFEKKLHQWVSGLKRQADIEIKL